MPESKPTMTKLATGRNLFALFMSNRQTLWLAGDYLLLLSSTGYTERVRRFYFADIQSIVHARTGSGRDMNLVCAIIAILLVLLGGLVGSGEEMMNVGLFIASLALLPLAGLVYNVIAGPTCACVISTAVHAERVLALNRTAKVERVIGQILTRIDAAQGRLTAEMLGVDQTESDSVEAGLHALGGDAVRAGLHPEPGTLQGRLDAEASAADPDGRDVVQAGRHAIEGMVGPAELRHEPGTFHKAAYVLCLVYAASHAIEIFISNRFYDAVVGNLLFIALVICGLVALRRQGDSDLPTTVKNTVPAILALQVLHFVCNALLVGYFIVLNPEQAMRGDVGALIARDSLVTQVYLVCGAMAFAMAGVMGLMRLARAGRAFSAAEKGFVARSALRDDSH